MDMDFKVIINYDVYAHIPQSKETQETFIFPVRLTDTHTMTDLLTLYEMAKVHFPMNRNLMQCRDMV